MNESTSGSHTSLGSLSRPSPPGRGRLRNHHLFQKSFPLAQGLSEIQESLSFLSSFLGIKEFTVEMEVLVFGTQCLELGFALSLLKIDQDEEKKKSRVAQVAGGKPSSNLRPGEDGQRQRRRKSVITTGVVTTNLCSLLQRSSIRPSQPDHQLVFYSVLTRAVTCFLPAEVKISEFREVELLEVLQHIYKREKAWLQQKRKL